MRIARYRMSGLPYSAEVKAVRIFNNKTNIYTLFLYVPFLSGTFKKKGVIINDLDDFKREARKCHKEVVYG